MGPEGPPGAGVDWIEEANGYHYLDIGTEALVIRADPQTISANFLANSGDVIIYQDLSVGGVIKQAGLPLDTLLARKENSFAASLPLIKGFNTSGDEELKLDSSIPIVVDVIRPFSNPGVTVDGDCFVDGHETTQFNHTAAISLLGRWKLQHSRRSVCPEGPSRHDSHQGGD